eukprot:scaffold1342_cov120-Isochrysis_galbana.AAC.9
MSIFYSLPQCSKCSSCANAHQSCSINDNAQQWAAQCSMPPLSVLSAQCCSVLSAALLSQYQSYGRNVEYDIANTIRYVYVLCVPAPQTPSRRLVHWGSGAFMVLQ